MLVVKEGMVVNSISIRKSEISEYERMTGTELVEGKNGAAVGDEYDGTDFYRGGVKLEPEETED